MRKVNAILSAAILVLFLVHAIAGGFQLAGLMAGGKTWLSVLARFMTALIAAHIGIGVKLTADTLRIAKRSGAHYYKENRLFWLRRISGFAIVVFIAFHLLIFMGKSGEVFRLHVFAGAELVTQILLVLTVAVHVLANIRPLMLALGVRGWKELFTDILIVLSVILLLAGLSFIAYYIRWNTF
ncbi:MAG TPA: pilus assembly protein PilX [Ruminococcus sp.]|nr:pilus assembly protein PilX [Ruminococcus sp.]